MIAITTSNSIKVKPRPLGPGNREIREIREQPGDPTATPGDQRITIRRLGAECRRSARECQSADLLVRVVRMVRGSNPIRTTTLIGLVQKPFAPRELPAEQERTGSA